MGRWAQAKRRSRGRRLAAALGPPPVPSLAPYEAYLRVSSNGTGNVNGAYTVEYRASIIDPWETWEVYEWAWWINVAVVEEWPGFRWRAKETGNGVDYSGNSDWTDEVVT